jgi:hypothetical protein
MHHLKFNFSAWIDIVVFLILLMTVTCGAGNPTFADTGTVRNGTASYSSLQTAFAVAATGDTLQAQATTFDVGLFLNRNINIILSGGYDPGFGSNADGATTIMGPLIVGLGSASLENFIIAGNNAMVTVPDLAGQTQASAQGAILAAGLATGPVTLASSNTISAGSVISQNPSASSSVSLATSVALVVSSGPPPATCVLTVNLGAGASGTPVGGASFARGASVNYAYTLQTGYTGLTVTLDGAPVAASGTVTMDAAHTLVISATPIPPPPVAHPRFLWTADWQTQWQQARTDNNFWWQLVMTKANNEVAGTPAYADDGTFGAIAYRVTGDSKYAVAAYNTLFTQISADTMGLGLVNEFASQFLAFDAPAFVIVYDWIYDGLNQTQRTTLMNKLIGIGDLFLHGTTASGKDFWQYMRIQNESSQYCADSDQTSYVYWTLALLDQALIGDSPRAGSFLTAQTKDMYGNTLGIGLDNTGTGGPPPASPTTLRDAIGDFARVSSGGAWLESCEYNRETTRMVIAGWQAMKQATGQDHFPEYARLMPELGNFIFHEISPDLKMSFDWGDNEEPRTMSAPWTRELMTWSGEMMLASGANRGTPLQSRLNRLIDELVTAYPDTMGRPMSGLGLLDFYPYDTKADWRNSIPRGYFASGMGHFRYHTGWSNLDSYFGAAFYTRTSADHEMGNFSDFQLYRKGEWAITSPQGYMNGVYEMHNSMGIGGESSMWKRNPVADEYSDSYAYVAGTTKGTPDGPSVWSKRPDSFCAEWTRSLFYLPTAGKSADSVVIYDRVDSPNTKEWVLHTPVAAAYASNHASWDTSLGQHVRLSILAPQAVTVTTYADVVTGYMNASELKYTLKMVPSATQDWNTFLNVVDVYDTGTAPVITKLGNTTGSAAEGVLLVRSGESDAVVMFSAVRGGRILSSGYTFSYTGTASQANLYFPDLDSSKTWTVTVDGQSVDVTMNKQGIGTGVGTVVVTGAGAHTIILSAS